MVSGRLNQFPPNCKDAAVKNVRWKAISSPKFMQRGRSLASVGSPLTWSAVRVRLMLVRTDNGRSPRKTSGSRCGAKTRIE
jgi:hypothetical protein